MSGKRKRWMIALLALAAMAAIGVTLAFMFKSVNIVNTFIPARVSCIVHEQLDGTEVTGSSSVGETKSDIRVENSGNVNEYLRVRLVSYFVDADGNISGTEPSVYPEITLNAGWLAGENHTYYYTEPVEPNGFTPVLCQAFTLSEKTIQGGAKVYQVVEVFAEAIQAEPDTAVQKAWNVVVKNGIITAEA